jgi:steroid 5-alpha reductase family enzyme
MKETRHASNKRFRDFSLCLLAYVLAFAVAWAVGIILGGRHPIIITLWADIAATLVIYLFSRLSGNSSFYDPYWSLAPLAIVLYWTSLNLPQSGLSLRQIVIVLLVFIWGLRLTLNWARQWQGLKHEDWRYTDFRQRSRRWFWLVDLVGIEIMPTSIVFLGCLSLYPALTAGENTLGILDFAGITVTAGAILIEALADQQLKRFMDQEHQPGDILERGLWAYSRHPNYFGEIAFWWGLFVFALASGLEYWWTIAGPLVITLLFLGVSIPLMEKRSLAHRPGYSELRKKVSVLIPWFPGK